MLMGDYLKEALFTVLQAGLHVVEGSAAAVLLMCIMMSIVHLALNYHAMSQQQLPYVWPAQAEWRTRHDAVSMHAGAKILLMRRNC